MKTEWIVTTSSLMLYVPCDIWNICLGGKEEVLEFGAILRYFPAPWCWGPQPPLSAFLSSVVGV